MILLKMSCYLIRYFSVNPKLTHYFIQYNEIAHKMWPLKDNDIWFNTHELLPSSLVCTLGSLLFSSCLGRHLVNTFMWILKYYQEICFTVNSLIPCFLHCFYPSSAWDLSPTQTTIGNWGNLGTGKVICPRKDHINWLSSVKRSVL